MVSVRADIVTRRTYNRPLNNEGTIFETWEQTIDRVISHQRWLWERALTKILLSGMPLHDITEDMVEWVTLNEKQEEELEELRQLMLERKVCVSGRQLWLGGTDISKQRESSMFNCAFLNVETIYDIVDSFWLLLQGCGVGFMPISGTLTGFRRQINDIEIIRSTRKTKGREYNEESFFNDVWYISVGDSAVSWAKFIGKLLAGKYKAKKLVINLSQIRPGGTRLSSYGWISSGDKQLAAAIPKICEIMNNKAGNLLSELDIIEIMNLQGTILSSRRSAEIALYNYNSLHWKQFATFKNNCYEKGQTHKQQSNNSLVFRSKPTKEELEEIFDLLVKSGGSEPGFINGEAAKKRAPWWSGSNPCITADTFILTDKGLRKVSDLINNSFNAIVDNKKYNSNGFFETGVKDVYELKTDKGYTLKATKNHKILTKEGWKELGSLTNKDHVILGNTKNKTAKVTSVEYSGKEKVYDCTVDTVHRVVANGIVIHNCNEILLGNKSFCNLVEIDLAKFKNNPAELHRAITIIGRANYRQTVVDLRDGILQEAWHVNNQFLHLCGLGLTGISSVDNILTEFDLKEMKYSAIMATRSMAKELDQAYPKNTTCVKPSGTLSKIMDTTEGVHTPTSKYLFNWINFSVHDPIIAKLKESNYRCIPNPTDPTGVLCCFPVKYEDIEFEKVLVTHKDGSEEELEINNETAIDQLNRYKKWQTYYCEQNVSNTIYYTVEEIPEIINWLLKNWDIYVGVSFLFKNDPTVSAKDLGFNYLPQEYVSKETFYEYEETLLPVNLNDTDADLNISNDECAGGVCPVI